MALFQITNLKSSDIPSASGVYIFRDSAEHVLYIGKARDLRKRLSSYLRRSGIPPRTAMMLRNAHTIEVVITPTEKDALILEATLIKRHSPRYNVVFRDDKAYPFLKIGTSDKWPRLSIVRRRKRDRAEYFGPYPSSGALRETIRLLTTTFGIRTCTNTGMKNRRRACLQFQIGKCSGPCIGAISEGDYRKKVHQVIDFFTGRSSAVIKKLKDEMKQASDALEFEKAAIIRDRIRALEKVVEKQSVVAGINASWDCIGLAQDENDWSLALLRVREGILISCETRRLSTELHTETSEVLQSFLLDFFQDAAPAREILLPEMPKDAKSTAECLEAIWGFRIKLGVPERGERKRLLDMASQNASQDMEQLRTGQRRWQELARLISSKLNLDSMPDVAECVDISTTGGEFPVGSLVTFRHGVPWKERYRIYNIRDVEGIDDFAMIHEVISRRMARAARDNDLPDLLLIDGGRGQLSRAMDAVRAAGFEHRLAVISIAKERNLEGEKIYFPDNNEPLMLEKTSPVLQFLQRMRDEAHRFGIKAHRRKRDSRRRISGLSDIPGVGPARQQLLLETFGSAAAVASAPLDRLKATRGVPKSVAERIYNFFHGQDS